jgi:hypothetical protein
VRKKKTPERAIEERREAMSMMKVKINHPQTVQNEVVSDRLDRRNTGREEEEKGRNGAKENKRTEEGDTVGEGTLSRVGSRDTGPGGDDEGVGEPETAVGRERGRTESVSGCELPHCENDAMTLVQGRWWAESER